LSKMTESSRYVFCAPNMTADPTSMVLCSVNPQKLEDKSVCVTNKKKKRVLLGHRKVIRVI
jgi:hypothetical protein